MGAHDALTSRLAGTYGFDAVWGWQRTGHRHDDLCHPGREPDHHVGDAGPGHPSLDRATDLPVIVDCDNGFGGLNNVVRTLVEFEAAGLAAICIEDNLFPKRNSLLGADTRRELVPRRRNRPDACGRRSGRRRVTASC